MPNAGMRSTPDSAHILRSTRMKSMLADELVMPNAGKKRISKRKQPEGSRENRRTCSQKGMHEQVAEKRKVNMLQERIKKVRRITNEVHGKI